MIIEDLIAGFQRWAKETIVSLRLKNGEMGYGFNSTDLKYTTELTLLAFQGFFDRSKQNATYVKLFNDTNIPGKKPHAFYQQEINMIYSYHKCFAMRHRSRLEYYRCDMSQKGARAYSAINIGLAKFMHLRDNANNPNAH